MKKLFILFFSITHISLAQTEISNIRYFSNFINDNDKSLIIVGENHSSSVGPAIYPEIIKYLNQQHGLTELLIEFGPSEAYFYNQYLKSGNERWLGYTIYAGVYKDWKKAWQKIYGYSQTLAKPLNVTGVDFDRARTMAYACYNIFNKYENRPVFIDSLREIIKTDEFFKTYTTGYPTKEDLEFKASVRKLFKNKIDTLRSWLSEEDYNTIDQIVANEAVGFNDQREKALAKTTAKIIKNSKAGLFLMLIGRDHAYINPIYDDKDRLARLIKKEKSFKTLSGLILHENSQQWGGKYEKQITLYEIRDKIPWKYYYDQINERVESDITIIPLENELSDLATYTDYIITAFNQGAIEF